MRLLSLSTARLRDCFAFPNSRITERSHPHLHGRMMLVTCFDSVCNSRRRFDCRAPRSANRESDATTSQPEGAQNKGF